MPTYCGAIPQILLLAKTLFFEVGSAFALRQLASFCKCLRLTPRLADFFGYLPLKPYPWPPSFIGWNEFYAGSLQGHLDFPQRPN
jgi:hypothetical protein